MRMIVHFGETLPEKITPEHIIGSGLLFIWALFIFCGMLFCFGIGAATGQPCILEYATAHKTPAQLQATTCMLYTCAQLMSPWGMHNMFQHSITAAAP